MDWLRHNNYCFWRNFVGPILHHGKFFGKNPMAGLPDILGVLKKTPGKLFAIEIKSETGKLSEDQRQWISALENAGALVIITRDLETVIRELGADNVNEDQPNQGQRKLEHQEV